MVHHSVKEWSLGVQLSCRAHQRPDKVFVKTTQGEALTYSDADVQANQLAHGLKRLDVGFGDRVALLLPNGLPHVLAWLACARLGAIHVAVNLEYRGSFLKHVLVNSQARVLFTAPEFLDNLSEISEELQDLQVVVVCPPTLHAARSSPEPLGLRRPLPASAGRVIKQVFLGELLSEVAGPPEEAGEVSYQDIASILYTSGTTGPSKGVLMPHAHNYLFGLGSICNLELQEDDVYYICLPLFHANALFMQLYAVLIGGMTAVLRERFSASEWLADIRNHGCTVTNTLGVMVEFLLRQPPSEQEGDHSLRVVTAAPLPPEQVEPFKQRFGVRHFIELYGMTEVNIPLYTPLEAPRPGSCGKPWERFYEVSVLHPETDEPLSPNHVGEICVRPRQPYGFMQGYHGLPEKTVEACRNFWFHTGDAGRVDDDGYFYFVDRIKDCIRRRGENISSFEVESALLEHPEVAEVAAIAVPSEIAGGEDEIKLVIVPHAQKVPSPESIWAFCQSRLPKTMQPLYLELVDVLPKTPTNKVQKAQLRAAGVSAQTCIRPQG